MTKREVLEKAISNASMLGSTYEDSAMTEESYQESYKVILDSALSELAQIEQAERVIRKEICNVCWTSSFAPVPKGTPNSLEVKDKDYNIICLMCKADEEIRKLKMVEQAEKLTVEEIEEIIKNYFGYKDIAEPVYNMSFGCSLAQAIINAGQRKAGEKC
ncbi:hypothetical protein FJZ33_02720 [Candidatus Poribacteria bacterium]|nr:hypothetical protein [Candidatus Poribacteria bacterium]